MPQFFVHGDTIGVAIIVGSHVDLSGGAGTHVGRLPVVPPVPVAVVLPPVPVVVVPPVPAPVVVPPVPVVVVLPPVPVGVLLPPWPEVVVVPPEPPVLPPVPETLSPLVQPYSIRPSASTAPNPATTNELRII